MKKKKKPVKVKTFHTKWNDKFYLQIYELIRQGLKRVDVAEILGVKHATLNRWVKEKPALRDAIAKAKERVKAEFEQTFEEYIFEKLSPPMQKLWRRLEEYEQEPNTIRKIELMLRNKGEVVRQHMFIHALVVSNFNISTACKRVHISKPTLDRWTSESSRFSQMIDEVMFHKKNFFDEALVNLVKSGDTAAVIFANKTMNRDRYPTTKEVTINGQVMHGIVNLDELDLPVDVMRQIVHAQQKQKLLASKSGDENVLEAEFERVEDVVDVDEED